MLFSVGFLPTGIFWFPVVLQAPSKTAGHGIPYKTRYPNVGELVSGNGGGIGRQEMGAWAAGHAVLMGRRGSDSSLDTFCEMEERPRWRQNMFMVSLGGHTTFEIRSMR